MTVFWRLGYGLAGALAHSDRVHRRQGPMPLLPGAKSAGPPAYQLAAKGALARRASEGEWNDEEVAWATCRSRHAGRLR